MKVLLPEGVELQGFERELKTTLEQAQLAGYALCLPIIYMENL